MLAAVKGEQLETLKDYYINNYTKFTKDYFEYEQCDQDIIVRGRLRDNIEFWESIGAYDYVFDVIKFGYKISFYKKSHRQLLNNNRSAFSNTEFVFEANQTLLDRNLIESCEEPQNVDNPMTI